MLKLCINKNSWAIFRALNQTLTVDTSLRCVLCEDYLISPVHLDADGQNICGECAVDKQKLYRNFALEDILKHLKYICFICDSIVSYDKITEHKNKHYVKCAICGQREERDQLKHMKDQHNVLEVQSNNLSFELEIDLPLKTEQLRTVTIGSYTFLFAYHQRSSQVIAMKLITISNDDLGNGVYNAQLITNNGNYYGEGNVMQRGDALDDGTALDMFVGDANKCKLKISLGNIHQQVFSQECPICMHSLGAQVRQCANGHNVCLDCGCKLNKCPQCSTPMKTDSLNLARLLPDMLWSCPNASAGCVAYASSEAFDRHLDACKYTELKCSECTEFFRMRNVDSDINHLDKHAIKCDDNVFKRYSLKERQIYKHYSYCHEQFFGTTVEVTYTDIKFKCRMLIPKHRINVLNYSEKYQYEFHICDNENAIIAKKILKNFVNNSEADQTVSRQILKEDLETVHIKILIFKNDY